MRTCLTLSKCLTPYFSKGNLQCFFATSPWRFPKPYKRRFF